MGVKTAAQRRLSYELGIPPEQVPPECMTFITRIHYLAQNFPDTRWGEHEVDYILIVNKDVDLDVNRNEVRDTRFVSQSTLKKLLAESRIPSAGVQDGVTPTDVNGRIMPTDGGVPPNNASSSPSSSGDAALNSFPSDVISPNDVIVTPWFRLLCNRDGWTNVEEGGGIMFQWWNNLDNLSSFQDGVIHNWT